MRLLEDARQPHVSLQFGSSVRRASVAEETLLAGRPSSGTV